MPGAELQTPPDLSPATINAIAERVVQVLRAEGVPTSVVPDPMSCAEFAKRIGRGVEFVQDRCRTRRIRTVDGKRPYQIPASELQRYLEGRR